MTIREKVVASLAEKPLTLKELSNSLPPNERSLLDPILSDLIDKGQVVVRAEGKTKLFVLKEKPTGPTTEKGEQAENSPVGLVATLPEQLWSSAHGTRETKAVFREIIGGTRTELIVVEPFIDTFMVEMYSEEFRKLAEAGRRVTLITRKIESGMDSQKAILRLFEIFATRRLSHSKLEVYEHWYPFQGRAGQQFQFVGLHAKILMNDEEAYVGSANWTEYSLGNNVEFGVVLKNPEMLSKLRELVFLVMTSSRKVDLLQMHQAALDRSRRA
jgi:phosphatidylserine/phosphatidylglycerophosphate/cardiolipin synthase-like enzyme